jgi:hypothetical protein
VIKGGAVRGFVLAAFLLLLAGCTADTARPVITAATDRASTRLPNFGDPGELEETLVAFGECVEKLFPIVMRFRADRFIGLTTEVGSQREEDGDRVDTVVADCMGQLDLERRLGAYQGEHPISGADQREMVEDFISCAGAVSPEVSDLVSGADVSSHNSVMVFLSELRPQNAGLAEDELMALSDCESEMTGPERVFSEGHSWFTP